MGIGNNDDNENIEKNVGLKPNLRALIPFAYYSIKIQS
jgi:hypothetical protein